MGNENLPSPIAIVSLNDKRLAHLAEDNQWHHFVYTWDIEDGTRKQYLDGKLLASGTFTSPIDTKLLVFGYRLPGALDELIILDRALSEEEVAITGKAYREGRAPYSLASQPEEDFFPYPVSMNTPRPEVPKGIDWRLGDAESSNEMRVTYGLGGFWRFQPTKSSRAETQLDRWFYIQSPSMWKPGGQLYDQNLEKTDFWKPSFGDIKAAGGKQDLNVASFPCAWFEKEFQVPAGPKQRQFFLRFPMGATLESTGWHSGGTSERCLREWAVRGKYPQQQAHSGRHQLDR